MSIRTLKGAPRYFALLGIVFWALFTMFPLYWVAVTSFKTSLSVVGQATFVPFLDFEPSLQAWRELFSGERGEFFNNVIASTVIGLSSAVLATAIGAMAAYALVRFPFRVKLASGLIFFVIACGGYLLGYYLFGFSRAGSMMMAFAAALLLSVLFNRAEAANSIRHGARAIPSTTARQSVSVASQAVSQIFSRRVTLAAVLVFFVVALGGYLQGTALVGTARVVATTASVLVAFLLAFFVDRLRTKVTASDSRIAEPNVVSSRSYFAIGVFKELFRFRISTAYGIAFLLFAFAGYFVCNHVFGFNAIVAIFLGSIVAALALRAPVLGNEDIIFWFVSQRMFPPIVTAFALFLMYTEVGRMGFKLVDTYIGMTLAYIAFSLPIVVWLMRDFFAALPLEVEEAAMVDNVPSWRIFLGIVVPMSVPGLIATFMITLAFVWNEFLFALFLTNAKWQTLPILVAGQNSQRGDEWWSISAAALVAIIPMMVMAALLSRLMRSGLLLGAIK